MGASFSGVICTPECLLGCKGRSFGVILRAPRRPGCHSRGIQRARRSRGAATPRVRPHGRPEIARRRGERRGHAAGQGHSDGRGLHRRIPGPARHRRRPEHRHRVADQADRAHHARLRLRQHGVDEVRHHLHRRRPGHPPLPRVSHRAAGEEQHLPRGRLAAHLRRAPLGIRAGVVRRAHPPSHAAARRPQEPFLGTAADGSPHVGAVGRDRRALDVLRVGIRPAQPRARRAQHRPHAREAPRDRGVRSQEEHRSGVPVPRQLAVVRRQLPQAQLRRAQRALRGQPGHDEGPRPAADAARGPRAERLDLDRAPGRLDRSEPVRVDLRRHPGAVRPPARWRERGRPADARAHPRLGRERRTVRRAGEEQGAGRQAHGLRSPRLQELRPAREARQRVGRRGAHRARRQRPASRPGQRARADRPRGRLLQGASPLPERRLLHRRDLQGDGLPHAHVHGAVRDRSSARPGSPSGARRSTTPRRRSAARSSCTRAPPSATTPASDPAGNAPSLLRGAGRFAVCSGCVSHFVLPTAPPGSRLWDMVRAHGDMVGEGG
ncbi:hypothetical protein QE430_002628 [Microbacterium testaceum]|nr:hypothetical protein [Microbacterium testaceum]